eukprot:SAG22_NODE_18016_length_294_cov_2.456410_1_plen_35_part_00
MKDKHVADLLTKDKAFLERKLKMAARLSIICDEP